ncbi:MAG: zinc metalloprotease HtpX [Desulfobacteraceae bacterium]|nr:MAG: zinc metalloprotease HtpX [Desulfobacteraceae bacterium]
MGNQLRTTFLLAVLTILIVWIGRIFGGPQGMFIALLFAAAMNFFSYWYSDKIVLRMYRAQEVTPQQAPELYQMVSDLARSGGLPMPRVFIIPQDSPNAFATGRNPEHAVVAVTQGLLKLMNREQLKGVLAHEMAHVKGRDILIGSIAATLAGAIMMLASMARWSALFGGMGRSDDDGRSGALGMIVVAIVAPIAALVVQMAVSRSREYHADDLGARIAGNNEGLASALEKLGAYSKQLPMQANPSTAHMFIVNPLSGRSMMSLFATHPPIETRVARLRGIASQPVQGSSKTAPPLDPSDRGRAFWDSLR